LEKPADPVKKLAASGCIKQNPKSVRRDAPSRSRHTESPLILFIHTHGVISVKLLEKIKSVGGIWWSLILGVVAFLLITGGKIIIPTYTAWLTGEGGDPTQHYYGWVFFRNAPIFQWPIGANPCYGMDISGSIAHTDSLALFAILFKPFSGILPESFQYTGLWIFLSFLLQSVFAWKLLSLFTKDKLLPYVGSLFFLIAPIWLLRMGGHNSSFGQWAIVAGLYFYLRKDFRFWHWTILLMCIGTLNTYISMMVACIFFMDLVQRIITRQNGVWRTLVYLAGSLACVGALMYSIGYFMVFKGLEGGGYGVYRMNLLSLFDPDSVWSRVLGDIACPDGDWEGFNFLGIGMILLLPVSLVLAVLRPKTFLRMRLLPLFLLAVTLFVYAVSNRIAVGELELYEYPLPECMKFFAHSVRCSGRFFWPVYYLIYAAVLYLLFTKLGRRTALAVCAVAFSVQLADCSDAWVTIHRKFLNPPKRESPMIAPLWQEFTKRYTKLIYVMPMSVEAARVWLPLAEFAATNAMSVNTGYFSRVEVTKFKKARERAALAVLGGALEPDALYIFGSDAYWNIAKTQLAPGDLGGTLDGFRFVAPGFLPDEEALAAVLPPKPGNLFDYDWRKGPLHFGPKADKRMLIRGWSAPEIWGGAWSEAPRAWVFFVLNELPQGDVLMSVNAHSYLHEAHPRQKVEVIVNGGNVGSLVFTQDHNSGMRELTVPHSLLAARNGAVLVEFRFPDAKRPCEVETSPDGRLLGIGLKSLGLTPREP
jgi:hypothetical protein